MLPLSAFFVLLEVICFPKVRQLSLRVTISFANPPSAMCSITTDVWAIMELAGIPIVPEIVQDSANYSPSMMPHIVDFLFRISLSKHLR
jgi:hypothetical protein